MQEVDFTEADLTSATIDNCDLGRAIFEDAILEKAARDGKKFKKDA